jgi:hypothetical protein
MVGVSQEYLGIGGGLYGHCRDRECAKLWGGLVSWRECFRTRFAIWKLSRRSHSCAQWHFRRCIPSMAQRLSAGREPNRLGSHSMLWTVYRFHHICCFFTIRFATISLTADSTNPVEIRCPAR